MIDGYSKFGYISISDFKYLHTCFAYVFLAYPYFLCVYVLWIPTLSSKQVIQKVKDTDSSHSLSNSVLQSII